MEIAPDSIHHQSLYKLMIGSIVPRPIGWISSVDADGRNNLAPFSFFNAVCSNPPTVLFCPLIRTTDAQHKDTLNNVKATGEFVVNIVTEPLAEAMNLTSGEYPSEVDEFAVAGLTPTPSLKVRPMRVAESPIHYECVVSQIVTIGDTPGGGSIVIGRVVHLHVADELLIGEDKIDLERLQPIGRLAGTAFSRVNDIFHMTRPVANPNGSRGG
jgi:flavin reductase (DIM6/NTAB) family NADH-FMN oxidoreductase RutF